MNEREALKLALEALIFAYYEDKDYNDECQQKVNEARQAIRECLANVDTNDTLQEPVEKTEKHRHERKPLTDEEWQVIADTLDCFITREQKDAIEAVLGIKE